MEVKIVEGDLFETKCEVIAHQVNCTGIMGSGIAKLVRINYPEAFREYRKLCEDFDIEPLFNLGRCQLVKVNSDNEPERWIANLFGQLLYRGYNRVCNKTLVPDIVLGDRFANYENRYTNYEAIYRSLNALKYKCRENDLTSIALPYKLGSDRGGADCNIINSMIKSVFEKDRHICVNIYKLD